MSKIDDIASFLTAYTYEDVKTALKHFSLNRRTENKKREPDKDGWRLWEFQGSPPPQYEWRKVNEIIQFRPVPKYQKPQNATRRGDKRGARNQDSYLCPFCGEKAFPQDVCPKCLKGKAGIRKMFICGENNTHVFYTD